MKSLGAKAILVVLLVLTFSTAVPAKDPVAVFTPDAPAAVGPYSQAIKYGDLIFVSGQLPIDPVSKQIVGVQLNSEGKIERVDIAEQTRQVMLNLSAILEAVNLSLNDIVMATVYLADMDDFNVFNTEYAKFFEGNPNPPARATIQAGGIPKQAAGAMLEVSIIAGK